MQLTYMQAVVVVIVAAVAWGYSSVCGQFLFENYQTDPSWMITIRQLLAGSAFLIYLILRKKDIFSIWRDKEDAKDLLIFAFLGLLGAQYGFYYTIALSNAATATILQYMAPVFVVVWIAFKVRKMPTVIELISLALAVAGVFLLATHGNINEIVIMPEALFWGLLSGVALAVYSVAPVNLLKKYDTTLIMGWGQILSGLFLASLFNPFDAGNNWDAMSVGALAYIILGGTVLSFSLFLTGLKVIGPTNATLLASVEPLSSIVFMVIFLGTTLHILDYVGMTCIMLTVLILTLHKK